MINLIPNQAKKSVTLEYWLRVATSWFVLWAVALIIGICVLVPTYVLINIQVSVYEESARAAEDSVANYGSVSKDLITASKQARVIVDDSNKTSIHDYVNLFEGLTGNGITLSEVSLNRSAEGIAPVSVAGKAVDRESLAAFRDRLLNEASIASVDLPISNLAKDKDIQFNLTVTMNNEVSL